MDNTNKHTRHQIYQTVLMTTFFLSSALHAQTDPQPFLYEGTVGTAPVVMELSIDQSNGVTGRYFYRKHSSDIALDGKRLANGDIQLGENQSDGDHANIDMTLHPAHQGWQGEWVGHDPKKILIQLTPVTTHKSIYQLASTMTEYDQMRLSGLSLQKKESTQVGKYSLQWWLEPMSKIKFFRIESGYPADTLTRINTALTTRQWQEVNSYFECELGGARNSGSEYDQTVTPHLINDKVLSASVKTNYYCGGAHPDFSDSPINLDVHTGKELKLEDVFWLGNATTSLALDAHGDRVNYDYETKILGPWISQTMTKLYPKDVGSAKKTDDCNYRDPEVWQFPAFYFTDKGLHLAASFARVERPCDNPDWAILPWDIVNQHQGKLQLSLP